MDIFGNFFRGVSDSVAGTLRFISDLFAFQSSLDLSGNDELADFLRTGPDFISAEDRQRNLDILARGVPPLIQIDPGLDVFSGETTVVELFNPEEDASDARLATFEPDPLAIQDPEPAEDAGITLTPPTMPIIPVIGGVVGRLLPPLLTGTAFGAGTFLGDTLAGIIGTGDGGTSVAVPQPATTPSVGGNGVGGELTGQNGQRPPTIAEMRNAILRSIGVQHGRRSFSYNVARRILKDLGEEAGARCLGISSQAACFLLIHPPKRRGRQITPKQINRAMGAYKRVKALNKSVRKTLGPGCKL